MLFAVKQTNIDGNGESSIYGMLEQPKVNNRGLWDGCMGFNITNNHKRQSACVSVFMWNNGAPWNWEVIKTINGEVIEISEAENVLRKLKIIKDN